MPARHHRHPQLEQVPPEETRRVLRRLAAGSEREGFITVEQRTERADEFLPGELRADAVVAPDAERQMLAGLRAVQMIGRSASTCRSS